jgi:hypothetical protein
VLGYVLPLRANEPRPELTAYLTWLSSRVEVVVVDGSAPAVFTAHHDWWSPHVVHVPVDPECATPMGKVGGVLTGLRQVGRRHVIVADDDVRYTDEALRGMERLLRDAEVVRPQNVFTEWPWHARWDAARTLIARATGGDWPGTLGVDRDLLLAAGGYAGDVMFENLELTRTIEATGGRHVVAYDVYVPRSPPFTRQFWNQRVRQAYDELARPGRFACALAILPASVLGGRRAAAAILVTGTAAAAFGRVRGSGAQHFPASTVLFAPLWITERAITSWVALGSHLFLGGVRYRGTTLRRAANSTRAIRRGIAPSAGWERGDVGVDRADRCHNPVGQRRGVVDDRHERSGRTGQLIGMARGRAVPRVTGDRSRFPP